MAKDEGAKAPANNEDDGDDEGEDETPPPPAPPAPVAVAGQLGLQEAINNVNQLVRSVSLNADNHDLAQLSMRTIAEACTERDTLREEIKKLRKRKDKKKGSRNKK